MMNCVKMAVVFVGVLVLAVVSGCGGGGDGSKTDEGVPAEPSLKFSTTNASGQALFTDEQTGETVTVLVHSEDGQSLQGTSVMFGDADGFEVFYAEHPAMQNIPQFRLYPHNSSHTIEMPSIHTGEWTVEEYDSDSAYVEDFEEWAQSNWMYNGCWTKDELEAKTKAYTMIFSLPFVDYTFVVNLLDKIQDLAGFVEDLGHQPPDYYHEWVMLSPEGGNLVGTFVWYKGFEVAVEECNGLDDDCDKAVDEEGVCEDEQPSSGSEIMWTDPASGLTWHNPGSKSGEMSWEDARQYCTSLSSSGGGWHLPTIDELRSLMRGCPATETGGTCNISENDCLDISCWDSSCVECPDDGPGTAGCYWPAEMQGDCSWFWSASELKTSPGYAWYIVYVVGHVGYDGFDETKSVICVR